MSSVSNQPVEVKSWKSAMQDAMAGKFTKKEAEQLVTRCAKIADEALDTIERPKNKAAWEAKPDRGSLYIDMMPSWYAMASICWKVALKMGRNLGPKCPADALETFTNMGEVADWWLARKAEAAQ